jgi:hypothetical protein
MEKSKQDVANAENLGGKSLCLCRRGRTWNVTFLLVRGTFFRYEKSDRTERARLVELRSVGAIGTNCSTYESFFVLRKRIEMCRFNAFPFPYLGDTVGIGVGCRGC